MSEDKPKKKIGRPKGTKSGEKHVRILELRGRGHNIKEIAEKVKSNPEHVSKVLKQWEKRLPELKTVSDFRKARPDILSAAHDKVLKFITKDSTLEGARLGELAKVADVVHRQERLERGLSTTNKAEIRYTKVLLPQSEAPPEDMQPPVITVTVK